MLEQSSYNLALFLVQQVFENFRSDAQKLNPTARAFANDPIPGLAVKPGPRRHTHWSDPHVNAIGTALGRTPSLASKAMLVGSIVVAPVAPGWFTMRCPTGGTTPSAAVGRTGRY